jgi:hypothetical protein
VTTRIPGLPAETYDRTAAHLAGHLRDADGFIAHAASTDAHGVTATELWEAQTHRDQFLEKYVKPNLPVTLPPPTVVDIRNTILGNGSGGVAPHVRGCSPNCWTGGNGCPRGGADAGSDRSLSSRTRAPS